MKLCRFELLSEPGVVRSGFVHNAKVYETDGHEPKGMYEASEVRPLPPIGTPSSVRFFRTDSVRDALWGDEQPLPLYSFGNPGSLVGPSRAIPVPEFSQELDFEPYLAAVVIQGGVEIPVEHAEDFILGITIVNLLVARDVEREERESQVGPGRSRDIAMILGPVLTTPDELEDVLLSEEAGRRYKMSAVARVNGVERRRGDTEDIPFSFGQLISFVSQTGPLRSGDVFAIGPIMPPEEPFSRLQVGDKIEIAVEKLGILAATITEPNS